MKTVLYWFSGTGNSLVVARELAAQLGETELVPLARAVRMDRLPEVERVGLVFPVYAFGPPVLVAEFAEQAPLPKGGYIFSVATMGGMAGGTHHMLRRILRARGLDLAAAWSVVMPGNCISLSSPPKPEKQQRLFAKFRARLPEIAAAVREGRTGPMQDSLPPMGWLAPLVNRAAAKGIRTADKKFRVTDACNHCGICARVCSVGNIRMADGLPEWQHRCEQCFACINWCPTHAIEIGRSTVGRRQYHHPNVSVKDLAVRDE